MAEVGIDISHHKAQGINEYLGHWPVYYLIVVCDKGNRSALAADTLLEMGFSKVASLAGGLNAWLEAGHPLGPPRVL